MSKIQIQSRHLTYPCSGKVKAYDIHLGHLANLSRFGISFEIPLQSFVNLIHHTSYPICILYPFFDMVESIEGSE